jgi:hypothetical protein
MVLGLEESYWQAFPNFYADGAFTSQAILDHNHPQLEYFAGSRQGVFVVVHRFVPAGIHHILIGPDHLLFLVGLLPLGGLVRRLLPVVESANSRRTHGEASRGIARCPRNRMGNRLSGRLTLSGRRTPCCQTARWCLGRKFAVANEPMGFIYISYIVPAWGAKMEILVHRCKAVNRATEHGR